MDRIKLPFRKEKEFYSDLYDIIGFYPHHIQYYKEALMHKSVMRRDKGRPLNNERLEYLGDAILDAVVGDIVYRHFEGKREGFLTNARSKIVQRETLGKLAEQMGITRLILSSGHNSSHNSYMGGNAFEALVGAIYLDRGYEAVYKFMTTRVLGKYINLEQTAYKEVNFKSKLIEWTQKYKLHIDFRLVSDAKDKEGNPKFEYIVVLEGCDGCSATGYSKKESQQEASKLTLQKIKREPQFREAVFAAKERRLLGEEATLERVADSEKQEEATTPADAKPVAEKKERRQRKPRRATNEETDEFDLSDISAAKAPSREEIIAAAEEAAFEG